MKYSVCVNQPGYLPEMDPYEVDSLAEAREALREEIVRTVDAHDGPGAEEYGAQEAESLQWASEIGEQGGCIIVGDYAHEIAPVQ